MNILAVDTSTSTAAVAVLAGAPGALRTLAEREDPTRSHSDTLLALIDAALAESGLTPADVDGVAVGAGPGSFTGLRIGMATAKGLCFAAQKPLWLVSSLEALALDAAAAGAGAGAIVVPVIDARRREVFAGFYALDGAAAEGRGRPRALADERVLPPDELAETVAAVANSAPGAPGQVVLLGDAASIYPDALARAGRVLAGARRTPSAASVGVIAAAGPRDDALLTGSPVYIRPAEAEIKFPDGNPGGTFSPTRR